MRSIHWLCVLQVGFFPVGCRQLAPFVPTPVPVVERMLELAQIEKSDVVYDLGSGDGRIVIIAAKQYGARGVGLEIDPGLVRAARRKASMEGVGHLVEIRQEDLLTADFSNATVVTMYLGPSSNFRLRETLRGLKPGTRIVSHEYDMGDWEPERVEEVMDGNDAHVIYLWRIPPEEDAE